jgi:hypothetical protein
MIRGSCLRCGSHDIGSLCGCPCHWNSLSRTATEENIIKNSTTTMTKYKVGDVLVREDGNEKKVLAICGDIYGMSEWNNFECFSNWYTEKNLENIGFTLKSDEIEVMGHTFKVKDVKKKLGIK